MRLSQCSVTKSCFLKNLSVIQQRVVQYRPDAVLCLRQLTCLVVAVRINNGVGSLVRIDANPNQVPVHVSNPARNLLQRCCAGDICVDFCAAGSSFNPASPVVSALIAWSFLCSNEHTVVSDPALGQPISRMVKKFQTPAGTGSGPPGLDQQQGEQ